MLKFIDKFINNLNTKQHSATFLIYKLQLEATSFRATGNEPREDELVRGKSAADEQILMQKFGNRKNVLE